MNPFFISPADSEDVVTHIDRLCFQCLRRRPRHTANPKLILTG